jgi:TFIIF-interacting CTD phosphatase-like protein
VRWTYALEHLNHERCQNQREVMNALRNEETKGSSVARSVGVQNTGVDTQSTYNLYSKYLMVFDM